MFLPFPTTPSPLTSACWCTVMLGTWDRPTGVQEIRLIISGGGSRSRVRSPGSACTLLVSLQALLWSPCADHFGSQSPFPHLYPWPHRNVVFRAVTGVKAPHANVTADGWLSPGAVWNFFFFFLFTLWALWLLGIHGNSQLFLCEPSRPSGKCYKRQDAHLGKCSPGLASGVFGYRAEASWAGRAVAQQSGFLPGSWPLLCSPVAFIVFDEEYRAHGHTPELDPSSASC